MINSYMKKMCSKVQSSKVEINCCRIIFLNLRSELKNKNLLKLLTKFYFMYDKLAHVLN